MKKTWIRVENSAETLEPREKMLETKRALSFESDLVKAMSRKGSNRMSGQFMCNVDKEALNPDHLKKKFKRQYLEGHCTPHRFIIFNDSFDPDVIFISVAVLEKQHSLSKIKLSLNNFP